MVTIAEATIGVFVKLTEGQIPIYTLNFYRVLFAFVFLASVVPFIDRQFYKIRKKDIRPILIMGLLITLQISMFNIAMSMAPIANVVIFWSIAPFFVFIFSVLFLKESVNKEHIFIFIIALIGIFIAKPLSGGHTAGNIVALIDGAVYAALVSYMRFENRSESPGLVFWFMLTATVYLSPFLFIFGPGNLNALVHNNAIGLNVPVIVWAICLGMISTGVAYLFMTFSLKNIRANIYSLVDIIVSPIVAATFGYFIFNEVPSSNMIYGGALLLLSGFWLSHYMSGKKSIWHKIFRHYIPVSKEEKKYRSFKYYKQ
jgi:drug/metabolite transporter (DMT)-like permease